MSGEDGSDEGDGGPEDDNANGDGGSNEGDEGGEDGNDDGYWQDDNDEEDEEEYDEEDDEEETACGLSKKHKSVATSRNDTTDSEYDDDTDEDDPGYGSLLKHAREVYTLTSFHIFKNEYKKSKTLYVDVTNEKFDQRGLVFEYKLYKIGHYFREHLLLCHVMA